MEERVDAVADADADADTKLTRKCQWPTSESESVMSYPASGCHMTTGHSYQISLFFSGATEAKKVTMFHDGKEKQHIIRSWYDNSPSGLTL